MIAPILLMVLWTIPSMFTLEISHLELELGNRSCGARSSCMNYSNDEFHDLFRRGCMCDESCTIYGDCCIDSSYFDSGSHRRAAAEFECSHDVYMKKHCPSSWQNVDIRKKCEVSKEIVSSDPLLLTPVTSNISNMTYGNVYCALCNSVLNIEYWKIKFECPSVGKTVTVESMTDKLHYNNTVNSWQVEYNRVNVECSIVPSIPTILKSNVRLCVTNVIKACNNKWRNEDIRNRCEAYTSIVYNDTVPYKNAHCAICNYVPVQDLGCEHPLYGATTRFFSSETPFSILFDFRGGNTVGQVQPCDKNQLYDPFFKVCRDIITKEIQNEINNKNRRRSGNSNSLVTGTSINCSKYMLSSSEYAVYNETLYVPAYNKTIPPNQFQIYSNGSALICVDFTIAKKLVTKYKPYFGILTLCGITLSIVCLCIHLLAFALVEDLRNLSGMSLASFSFALLVAYCSFLISDTVYGKACYVNAVITYYFFLSAFFWMMTIAFDVWRALRLATFELRITAGKQWKRFLIYTAWSWLMPAAITITAVVVDIAPKNHVPDIYRPDFGTVSCWFGRGEALLLFFGMPLTIILIMNVTFFVYSAWMIYSSQSMTAYSASADTLKNFKLYSRLALIMGLTWIVGIVAGFVDNEILWVIFILLNTSQGVFIFIAFTFRRRVLTALKKIHKDRNALHLPTFSWSVESYDTSHPSDVRKQSNQSDKTTSTAYYSG